jgi:predicted Ser/Thr protein kinase
MASCASCGTETSGRFCSACGAPLDSDLEMTAPAVAEPRTPAPAPKAASKPRTGARPSASSPASSGGYTESRFLPGTLLAERYRIVAPLGKGGMGEVYRADDLTLGQPVALKFLPDALARDEETLNRFRNEVRVARRVSHSNVCRVYDVGEVEGHTFLTMEYVDGEDLASLLRRIGRLPGDKALEIARQLCAGLAAAHREGVLHRDLKPANVMLDGRGRAVMTDFGLASLAERIEGYDARSGTPAYMAPEQLAGLEVTAKSDIYSLGLVLYEIFTGKRAFDAEALADLVKQRHERPVSNPSTWVKDLDPAVERVIMRCLEADPANRPAAALAVAAALPGGDPLAAALAAGETPSPQMVAAAGETGGIAPRAAVAGLAAVIVALAVIIYIDLKVDGLRLIGSVLPPDVLAVKAQEVIRSLGYPERPVDHAAQFYYFSEFTDYVHDHDVPKPDWPKVLSQPPLVLQYAYRQSPVYLDPDGYQGTALTPGVVQFDDPHAIQSGMINVILDSQGRLTYLQAIPKEYEPNPPPAAAVDWKPLFAAAGLDVAQFHSAETQWVSLAAFDTRLAWTGVYPGSGRPLRIEAAAFRGRPVYFLELGPWSRPSRMQTSNTSSREHAGQIMEFLLAIVMIFAGSLIARRNYKRGKVDLQGAFRLASAVFVIEIATWVCRDHFIPTLATFGRFILAVSTGLFISGAIWMLYLALEPYIRRHWPQAIISWSRLMTGRVRDPLVGRDVLWGVVLGMLWNVVIAVGFLFLKREGATPQLPSTSLLLGGRQALGIWLLQIVQCILGTIEFFFILFLLRVLLRNKWLAAAAFVAFFAGENTLRGDHPQIMAWIWLIVYGLAAYAVSRFGLITLAVAIFTANIVLNVPVTFDFSNWYATTGWAVMLSFLAIAAWGFHTSLGGQKLWKEDLFA